MYYFIILYDSWCNGQTWTLCLFPSVYVVHLSQVLVSNSLAALSGSSSERSYCDNLNISVCPITESSKKVGKKKL